MADNKTTPSAATVSVTEPTAHPAPAPADVASPRTPRTVTLPVLPLAIVSAVIVALLFFGGGVAVGFAIGDHPVRSGTFQPFQPGRLSPQGGLGGPNSGPDFGQHNGKRPNLRPTPAPTNG